MSMEKISQELGFFDKAREFTNLSGQLLELSQSEFKSIMQELRSADDSVREVVVGKNSANKRLKDILKEIESNFNRKEYLVAIAEVVTFKEVIDELNEKLKSLNIEFIKAHYDLLAENLSPEARSKLLSLKESLGSDNYNLIKQAGLLDVIYNFFSSRSKTLKSLEQRYPRAIKSLKTTTSGLFKACNSLYSKLLQSLKRMKESRIKRNIEDYLTEKNRLITYIDSFNSQFKSYYNANLKKIIDQLESPFTGDVVETPSAPQILETKIDPAVSDLSVTFSPKPLVVDEAVPLPKPKEDDSKKETPTMGERSDKKEEDLIKNKINFSPKKLFNELQFNFEDSKDPSPQLQELCSKAEASLSNFKPEADVNVMSENYVKDMENHINYALLANEVSIAINNIILKIKNIKDESYNKIKAELLELKKINKKNPIVYLTSENVNKICNDPAGSMPFKENIRSVIAKTIEKIKSISNEIKYSVEPKKDETEPEPDLKDDEPIEKPDDETIGKSIDDDAVEKKDDTTEILDRKNLIRTAASLNQEIKNIISELTVVNINNYREVCDKYISQVEKLNNKINLFNSNFEILSESDPLKLKINNISKIIKAINIENFKKMYYILKSKETADPELFKFILNKINSTFNRLKEGAESLYTKEVSPIDQPEPASPPAEVSEKKDEEKPEISSLSAVELNKFKINFYNNLSFKDRVIYTTIPTDELKDSFIAKNLSMLNEKLTKELESLVVKLNMDKSVIPSAGNKLELFNKLSELKNELVLKLSKKNIQDLLKTTAVARSQGVKKGEKITIPGEVEKLLDLILSDGNVEDIKECVYGIQDIINYLVNKADQETEYRDYYTKYDIYNCLQSIVANLVKNKEIDFNKLNKNQKDNIKKIFTTDSQFYASLLGKIGGALHRQDEFELIKHTDIPVIEEKLSNIPSEYLDPQIAYRPIAESEKSPISSNEDFNKIISSIGSMWKSASGMKDNIKKIVIKSIVNNISAFLKDKDQKFKSDFIKYLEVNQKSIRGMSADIDLPYVTMIIENLKKK